ncbi:hypothetical protein OAJ00_00165 [Paracoccaceae bacterium]|nr:hypothetical protein [Paracoccaceae bacterium]
MSFKLKSTIVGSILSFMAPTVLVAAEANDNYNTATTEKWVNDSSNTAVQLLDIMTCMGGAGGISRPGFANKSWIALVDEKACGIDDGDTSAQEKKATIQFSSTLAAAGGTQEIVGYMEQSDGNKVIMNMQIKKSAATLPPYGDWYSSFYFVNDPSKDFAGQTGSVFHGYGEVKQVGSDVVVMSAHSPSGSDGASVETKIVYAGGSIADVTYNYKFGGLTGDAAFMNGNYLGKASSTYLYTGFVNTDGEFQNARAQCKKRDSVWQSSWKGALYDTTTNARLKLATPPFQFTLSDGSRGDARKDHSWMENNTVRLGLDPDANTIAITRSDTNAAATLQWTPTRMETKSYSDFTPASGDIFNSGESTDGMAEWDGTNDLKVDQDGNAGNGREATIDRVTRVWSSFYDAEFLYDGSQTPGTWKMINRIPFVSGSYPASGTSAKYKCYATYNCPHTSTHLSNINPTLAQYKTIMADNSTDWWQEFHGGKDVNHNGNTEFHYYLTAITPPTGYLGATLYWDDEKDGLDPDDKPVMFKFNVANIYDADDGQWAKKAMSHGEDTAVNFTTDGEKYDFTNELRTEGMWSTLLPDASSCDATNWHTCADAVDFNTRQYVYDHPLIPINAAGTVIDISPVMKMKYTQVLADDLNYNGGVPIVIPATLGANEWIEWLSKPCTPGMTEDLNTDQNDSTCQINIDLSKFNDKVLNIRYDGEMNNLPGYYDRAQDTFYRLINPKDGAIFTNMADDKTYKYKALGIDEVFVPEALASSCGADVKFTAIPTGFAASDLPSYSDTTKSRPSQTWNTKPTAPSCILDGEVETNCD